MNDLILIFAVVVPTVTLGIWWALRPTEQVRETVANDVPAILFRDGVLEHASDAILARLPIALGAHTWQDLHEILVTDYPEFPPSPAYQADGETVVKGVTGDILISWHPNAATLTFHGSIDTAQVAPDAKELAVLREVSDHLPLPAWKTDETGKVV